jgi:hypothetical protein
MNRRSPLLALLPLLVPCAAPANGPAAVALTQASEVDGTPLVRAIVGVAAPASATLPFHVSLDFRCPAGARREELFVSIADTARVQDATGSPSPRTLRVDVPLKQMQWLAQPERSCASIGGQRPPDEIGEDGTRFFRLHAGAAAYATVTCSDADSVTTATSTTPLDVWLSCPAENQGSTLPQPAGR